MFHFREKTFLSLSVTDTPSGSELSAMELIISNQFLMVTLVAILFSEIGRTRSFQDMVDDLSYSDTRCSKCTCYKFSFWYNQLLSNKCSHIDIFLCQSIVKNADSFSCISQLVSNTNNTALAINSNKEKSESSWFLTSWQ